MGELLIGTSAHPNAHVSLMREAGIGWVRHNFPLPFSDRLYGKVRDSYLKARKQAEAWLISGIEVMGVTPGPGHATYEPDAAGKMQFTWHGAFPEWFGAPGSAQCYRSYEAVCAWLAEDLKGIVSAWQIANELEIRQFAGPFNLRQACELILAGARGLKRSDPSLFVGPNSGGAGEAHYLYGRLYADPQTPLDYCGVDQYYGTWQPGGPDSWAVRVPELHELTGHPVVINEWGFASAGQVMTEEELRLPVPNCQLRKWRQTWGPGHTPEGQAEFVRAAFDAFVAHRSALAGVVFYRWEDQESCWQCGRPDCPVETAWGLVDLEGRPKPSFHAFQDGVRRLLAG
jgi:hypothetical protein